MKKVFKLSLAILVIAMVFISCDDKVKKDPQTQNEKQINYSLDDSKVLIKKLVININKKDPNYFKETEINADEHDYLALKNLKIASKPSDSIKDIVVLKDSKIKSKNNVGKAYFTYDLTINAKYNDENVEIKVYINIETEVAKINSGLVKGLDKAFWKDIYKSN